MTAQISDIFLFKGEQYMLIRTAGDRLISPDDYGMHPVMISTACYRGFHAVSGTSSKFIQNSSTGHLETIRDDIHSHTITSS